MPVKRHQQSGAEKKKKKKKDENEARTSLSGRLYIYIVVIKTDLSQQQPLK